MKKITRLIATFATLASLVFVPAAAFAAEVDPLPIEPDTTAPETTALPQTGGVPDTGIAPSNRVAQTTAVFIGGSALGAGIGLGIISLRKKRLE